MDWIGGWVEGGEKEATRRDIRASGLSTWWVAVSFPGVGKRAGGRGRHGTLVWGM